MAGDGDGIVVPANPCALTLRDDELAAFQQLVQDQVGIRLDDGKRQLLVSRLGRRLRARSIGSFRDYYHLLRQGDPDGSELRAMIDCITTNTTSFFREAHHFDFLRDEVFTQRRGPVRIWSCAASSGEEPYSIAMAAREAFGDEAASRVSILASDVDTRVLETAETGVYGVDRLDHLAPDSWKPHFLQGHGASAGQVRVKPELRRLINFRRVNLVDTPWPSMPTFDVIFCRNVIIYFDREQTRSLIARLGTFLRPGGHLILGHSENLPERDGLFEPLGQTIYRRSTLEESPPEARPDSADLERHTIGAGDVLASHRPIVIRSVLGSCVAACLYDPEAQVGGMNNFALPTPTGDRLPTSRYGVHAMECLINEIMKLGGDRRRLRAKVFGGCRVLSMGDTSRSVATQNAQFVNEFLTTEGIPLVGQKLGGEHALELLFDPTTGRAWARSLGERRAMRAAEEDARYRERIERDEASSGVTIFGGDRVGVNP